jgi:hypothetical protein
MSGDNPIPHAHSPDELLHIEETVGKLDGPAGDIVQPENEGQPPVSPPAMCPPVTLFALSTLDRHSRAVKHVVLLVRE